MLATQLERGRTTAYARALRDQIRALTIADLERVAKRYMHPERLVIVDAGSRAP